ncbi:Uncharacterized protein OBRU01_07631, partial [Operophtera brumata]
VLLNNLENLTEAEKEVVRCRRELRATRVNAIAQKGLAELRHVPSGVTILPGSTVAQRQGSKCASEVSSSTLVSSQRACDSFTPQPQALKVSYYAPERGKLGKVWPQVASTARADTARVVQWQGTLGLAIQR